MDIGEGLLQVDAASVVNSAAVVGDGDPLHAEFRQRERCFAADVAKTLNGRGGLRRRNLEIVEIGFGEVGHAAAGGFPPALGTAE